MKDRGVKRILFSRGFTLLELLVAMALVALVTLIAATAFRLTVQAWERGSEEGESRQIQSALPVLLEKQLASRMIAPIFGAAKVNPAVNFCGDENTLSFITAYAPQGSVLQGMQWVRYQFDAGSKTLLIYQQSMTRQDDLPIAESGLKSKTVEAGDLVSQIQGISDFRLAYTGEPLYDSDEPKQWQKYWECGAESKGMPSGLMLKMTIGEGVRSRSFRWCYRIGIQQSANTVVAR
ncbi:MAG: prepilin-type N-terminal cleavage/methylation domain-containing protein [Deltaproteobacteria bacterium]|nr:prepilin-type N-terminal cleavage/methylation domain-containing protein [Deltaproteobacteria bacterium]